MVTLKVDCLTATMSQVQRDLGEYGLRNDVVAFWAQFAQKYNKVAALLRKNSKNSDRIVKREDDMDEASNRLFLDLLDWLKTM